MNAPPNTTAVCPRCREEKALGLFAKERSRGKPIVYLCRVCKNEQVKETQRKASFAAFELLLPTWPGAKIESEMDWLQRKLDALRAERRRRDRHRATTGSV